MIRTNIRIYSYKKDDTNIIRMKNIRVRKYSNIRIYLYQKNDTNEYPNIFVTNKCYEYDTNEYSYQKIFEYTNTFISNF